MIVTCALLINLFEILLSNVFCKNISVLALEVSSFLKCLIMVEVPVGKAFYYILKTKADTRINSTKKPMLTKIPNAILKSFRTEQVRQILSFSLPLEEHGDKENSSWQLFYRRFL